MALRYLAVAGSIIALGLLSGCGASYSGVQAEAPGPVSSLAQKAPGSGQFTLYKASGFDASGQPDKIERVWTVSLDEGQPMGFKWLSNPAHDFDPSGGAELQAFAGRQALDLGAFRRRDVKYVWAGSQADISGYFQSQAHASGMRAATMQ